MNLTDAQQRAIYMKLGYSSAERHRSQWRYFSTETHRWRCCPPLDMNTAFSECIPKLVAENVKVVFEIGNRHQPQGAWWLSPAQYPPTFQSVVNPDFYAALLQYLGVK
jgi:hypothetical protein